MFRRIYLKNVSPSNIVGYGLQRRRLKHNRLRLVRLLAQSDDSMDDEDRKMWEVW